MINVYTLIFI